MVKVAKAAADEAFQTVEAFVQSRRQRSPNFGKKFKKLQTVVTFRDKKQNGKQKAEYFQKIVHIFCHINGNILGLRRHFYRNNSDTMERNAVRPAGGIRRGWRSSDIRRRAGCSGNCLACAAVRIAAD